MSTSRYIWQKPWSFKEGIVISSGILVIGLLLNGFTSFHFKLPSWPWNIILGFLYLLYIVLMHIFLRRKYFIQWLSSVSAAISAIVLFLFIVLLMGLIPQQEIKSGGKDFLQLYTIKNSWLFFLSLIYLLTVLGLTILRRIYPFTLRNIAFTLQHGGLWLLALVAGLASADVERYQVPVYENQIVEVGYNTNGERVIFPFKIHLIDFSIDEFPAKLAVVDIHTEEIDRNEPHNLSLIKEGLKVKIKQFNIEVEKYYPFSMEVGDSTYIPSSDSLSGQAALLNITDERTGKKYRGWISSGSPLFKASYIQIDDYIIAMTIPQPKKFSSKVKIIHSSGKTEVHTIAVNYPIEVSGWKLYQIGYDENMGRYSKLSILEAVRDAWLPFVYTGIILLMLGTIYLFWTGNQTNSKQETKL